MTYRYFLYSLTLLMITACATWDERPDTVVGKSLDHDVQISMAPEKFKLGDHIQTYRSVCERGAHIRGGAPYSCEQQVTGSGRVVQLVNPTLAVVQMTSSPAQTRTGDLVQTRE